jgi:hypothetical protein
MANLHQVIKRGDIQLMSVPWLMALFFRLNIVFAFLPYATFLSYCLFISPYFLLCVCVCVSWSGLGCHPGRRSEKPATNRLSYSTALLSLNVNVTLVNITSVWFLGQHKCCCKNMQDVQGVLKRSLQWYSKYYCVASVTKTFTLKGLQILRRWRCWTMDSLYAFKCKRFRNTHQTITFWILL